MPEIHDGADVNDLLANLSGFNLVFEAYYHLAEVGRIGQGIRGAKWRSLALKDAYDSIFNKYKRIMIKLAIDVSSFKFVRKQYSLKQTAKCPKRFFI